MKALKIITLFFLSHFITTSSYSQFYFYNDKYYTTQIVYEAGIGAGLMNCITDIGGANTDNTRYFNEIRLKNNKISKSIYAGVTYENIIGAKIEATLGSITSDDSTITGRSNNIHSKFIRNLSFKSKIAEVAFMIEFHPLQLLDFQLAPNLSPYVLGGVGIFHFNPQAQLNGKWVDLQPLHTEGQGFAEFPDRKPYKLTQFNVPIGLGLRYETGLINFRLEFVHRRLFTDYLDDASIKKYIDPSLFSKYLSPSQATSAKQLYNRSIDGSIPIFRGHSQNNDAYMSLSLKVGIVFGRESTANRTGTKQLRCAF